MGKPRIIIADTNDKYILTLQLKFAEEFMDDIELEIITSRSYYERLFSKPQDAAILIVSEDLYDDDVHKHNIKNIFLMTEEYEEEATAALNINRLHKYNSIQVIFNEISSKCADILGSSKTSTQEPQLILVYSACGGTGKTTVAMGISACLTKNHKRVLYINAGRLQYFQHMLEDTTPINAAEVYTKLLGKSGSVYADVKPAIRKELFSYVPAFKRPLLSMNLDYSVFTRLALSAKRSNDYDFIVVDADSAFDMEKANLINMADRVVVVTSQYKTSVYATELLVSYIDGFNPDKYIFVCNNFDRDAENAIVTPGLVRNFAINEYVEHYHYYDQRKCTDWAKDKGIQDLAFLIM